MVEQVQLVKLVGLRDRIGHASEDILDLSLVLHRLKCKSGSKSQSATYINQGQKFQPMPLNY